MVYNKTGWCTSGRSGARVTERDVDLARGTAAEAGLATEECIVEPMERAVDEGESPRDCTIGRDSELHEVHSSVGAHLLITSDELSVENLERLSLVARRRVDGAGTTDEAVGVGSLAPAEPRSQPALGRVAWLAHPGCDAENEGRVGHIRDGWGRPGAAGR